jgi:CheY-like chemotaxis protein
MTEHARCTTADRPFGVLLASGDAVGAKVIGDGLRSGGFNVWSVPNGGEALSAYGQHAAGIDVVLLDVRLPVLDGPQTLLGLRRINAGVRCYFMSSDIGSRSVKSLTALGADGVLMKPFSVPYVARMLSGARQTP